MSTPTHSLPDYPFRKITAAYDLLAGTEGLDLLNMTPLQVFAALEAQDYVWEEWQERWRYTKGEPLPASKLWDELNSDERRSVAERWPVGNPTRYRYFPFSDGWCVARELLEAYR